MMEGFCSEGQLENADCCCACKFPLPLFCTHHATEHKAKEPGLHFTLPLRAIAAIPSRQVYYKVQEWLVRLNLNFAVLREKFVEFCREEEKIEAVYQELQHYALEAKVRLLKEFSVAKRAFQTLVESAIKETSDHALDTQSFVPVDPISQLLWFYDPSSITAYQIYDFQARSGKEELNSAFKVELHFAVPGLEHLNLSKSAQRSSVSDEERTAGENGQSEKSIEELKQELLTIQRELQDLTMERAAKNQLISALKNENVTDQVQILTDHLEASSLQLRDQAKELMILHTQISIIKKDRDNQLAALTNDINALKHEQATLLHQLKAKDDQLTAASSQLNLIDQSYSALQTENKRLETLVTEKEMIISASEVSVSREHKECAVAEDQHRVQIEGQMKLLSVVSEPVEKLIAVLPDEVQCFDLATSQWQRLFTFRPTKRIFATRQHLHADESTSSILMNGTRIFVCGGGGKPCTCYVDNRAYVLEGDGTVQKLPHLRTGRYSHGLAWDATRNAIYVFGGSQDDICTSYTVLRSSEQFQANKWTAMPDMHHARRYFNPCWHCSVVYLCGGWTTSVETYNPRSDSFNLQDLILPEALSCTAVVECGVLTVISWNYISKLQQGRFTSQQHAENNPWSNCAPLVNRGVVYIVDIPVCRGINLTTGQVEKEVSLSL